jgi:hypothetical protein
MEGLIVPGIFGALLAIAGLVLLALDARDRRREQRNKSK